GRAGIRGQREVRRREFREAAERRSQPREQSRRTRIPKQAEQLAGLLLLFFLAGGYATIVASQTAPKEVASSKGVFCINANQQVFFRPACLPDETTLVMTAANAAALGQALGGGAQGGAGAAGAPGGGGGGAGGGGGGGAGGGAAGGGGGAGGGGAGAGAGAGAGGAGAGAGGGAQG